MGLFNLVKNFARLNSGANYGANSGASVAATATKSSAAGPMIAWSGVGQPKWTPRRYNGLAEEGFRKNVIAYRCVMQIATASSAIPWLLYDEEGHEIDRHPLLGLLQHPNPLQDGVSFLESIYAYLEIAGNAYIEAVTPHDGGAPVELYVLRPDRMKVIPGPAGLPQGYQYSVNGQVTTWPADPITGASNILHLKRFHPLDDWYGLAPMEAALLSIDQHNAAGAWNQALLNQGARPSGALVYAPKDGPNTLTDDQIQRLRDELSQLYQGSRNAGRPMILEGGLDWREMSLSPKDMDWLAGRNNAARDIAQAFGVPGQLIGIPDSQTYSNMAEARLAFYEETVLPIVTRVIAGVDHWLTPMFDDNLQLDFDPDSISALTPRRDAKWNKLQAANFLTRNEKREAAGYGPVPGGDEDDGDDSEDGPPAGFTIDGATVTPLDTPWMPAKFNPNHEELERFSSGSGGDVDGPKPVDAIKLVYSIEEGLALILGEEGIAAAREALGFDEGLSVLGESAAESDASGVTSHAAERLNERGITSNEVHEAIQTAKTSGSVTTQTGKYGTPQSIYKGSNSVTVIVELSGRNTGKVITSYRQ